MATAKHKIQKLVFNPANQKIVVFVDEIQKQAKDAFVRPAHAMVEQFIYAKLPPHIEKTINQAHLENGTYEQIVTHLEREVEPKDLETADELHMVAVSQYATNTNAGRPKLTCLHYKRRGNWRNHCCLLKILKLIRETKTVAPITQTQTTMSVTTTTTTKTITEPKTIYSLSETCGKTNHSTEKGYFRANAVKRPLLGQRRMEGQNQVQEGANQIDLNEVG